MMLPESLRIGCFILTIRVCARARARARVCVCVYVCVCVREREREGERERAREGEGGREGRRGRERERERERTQYYFKFFINGRRSAPCIFFVIVHGDADISSIESPFYIPLSTIITGLGNHAHATVFVYVVS